MHGLMISPFVRVACGGAYRRPVRKMSMTAPLAPARQAFSLLRVLRDRVPRCLVSPPPLPRNWSGPDPSILGPPKGYALPRATDVGLFALNWGFIRC